MSTTIPVSVHILGKEYRIACPQDEKDDLLATARYVDERMRQIRTNSQISGLDKIAVLAALNIAHEFTQLQQQQQHAVEQNQHLAQSLQRMQENIERALAVSLDEPPRP